MNPTALLVGVGAYAAFTLLKKKSAAGALSFGIAGADASFDGLTPVINIRLSINNPSDSQFLIKSIVGNVSANGSTIGNVANYQEARIQPRATVYYNLPVRLSLLGIAADVYNAITQGGWQQEIQFKGTANVDTYLAPIEINYLIG